jgi:hypothetical protein
MVVRCEKPDWVSEAKQGSRGAGVRFERQVLQALKAAYGDQLEMNPWFMFLENNELRYCSPDAILHLNRPVVIEVKNGHCERAYLQLHKLYIPVLQTFFDKPFRAVEIVKWYDPKTHFPGAMELISSVERAPYIGTGIHIFNGNLGV